MGRPLPQPDAPRKKSRCGLQASGSGSKLQVPSWAPKKSQRFSGCSQKAFALQQSSCGARSRSCAVAGGEGLSSLCSDCAWPVALMPSKAGSGPKRKQAVSNCHAWSDGLHYFNPPSPYVDCSTQSKSMEVWKLNFRVTKKNLLETSANFHLAYFGMHYSI